MGLEPTTAQTRTTTRRRGSPLQLGVGSTLQLGHELDGDDPTGC
jgi:hypothetical protein